MVTYYDDRRVRITSVDLWVDGCAYKLDELSYVWHRRGRAPSRRTPGSVFMLGGGLLGLLAICAISSVWRVRLLFRHDLMAIAILVAGFVAGAALTWPLLELTLSGMDHLHIHGVATHELWAQRDGEDLLLLRTSDALRFGQIYRALGRALEGGA